MELTEYLRAITVESAALAGVAETHPSLAVPACPEWQVSDLARHVGNVQRWAARTVDAEEISRIPFPEETPADAELGRWLRDGTATLVAALEAAGPDKPVWTMGEPRTSTFWFRRQAQETTLHRWDAEEAVGIAPSPIDSELAADGVAEFLELLLPGLHRRRGEPGAGETVHVHRTDGPGEWLVRFDPSGVIVTTEHAKGDVAVRGSAADLLLVLWRRQPPASLEVVGSDDVLARWNLLIPAI